jgi:hypothetical protein
MGMGMGMMMGGRLIRMKVVVMVMVGSGTLFLRQGLGRLDLGLGMERGGMMRGFEGGVWELEERGVLASCGVHK